MYAAHDVSETVEYLGRRGFVESHDYGRQFVRSRRELFALPLGAELSTLVGQEVAQAPDRKNLI